MKIKISEVATSRTWDVVRDILEWLKQCPRTFEYVEIEIELVDP